MKDWKTTKFILRIAASLGLGPFINPFMGLRADEEQDRFKASLETLQRDNPRPSFSLMGSVLSEIIGNDGFQRLQNGETVRYVINPQSMQEMEPFREKGWLKIKSTGTQVAMGSGNKIANAMEELKRPYGFGGDCFLSLDLDKIVLLKA